MTENLKIKCQKCGHWCDANSLPYEDCPNCGFDRETTRRQAAESASQSIRNQIEADTVKVHTGRDITVDEFTELLVKAVTARDAFESHECKEHPKWCPGHDIGCDEAHLLIRIMAFWEEKAMDEIVLRGLDFITTRIVGFGEITSTTQIRNEDGT